MKTNTVRLERHAVQSKKAWSERVANKVAAIRSFGEITEVRQNKWHVEIEYKSSNN
jgi:hypothetical protein